VIGLSPNELRSMTMPACVSPARTRPRCRQAAHRLMPNAEYHQVVTDDHADLDAAFADWDRKEGLLALRLSTCAPPARRRLAARMPVRHSVQPTPVDIG
jgi:hypothetical protein